MLMLSLLYLESAWMASEIDVLTLTWHALVSAYPAPSQSDLAWSPPKGTLLLEPLQEGSTETQRAESRQPIIYHISLRPSCHLSEMISNQQFYNWMEACKLVKEN